ncbi:MAG: nitroreductase family deazaflavin-dependent oxidoreductase [Ktedonobacteraceae bacterium]
MGGYLTYLLTVRGRKSGQPRTVPIVLIERNGKRHLTSSPSGVVDWVHNLRAAGEAILTRGQHSETVRAIELPSSEASSLLKRILEDGIPSFLQQYFEVTANSSREEFERAVVRHLVFSLHES